MTHFPPSNMMLQHFFNKRLLRCGKSNYSYSDKHSTRFAFLELFSELGAVSFRKQTEIKELPTSCWCILIYELSGSPSSVTFSGRGVSTGGVGWGWSLGRDFWSRRDFSHQLWTSQAPELIINWIYCEIMLKGLYANSFAVEFQNAPGRFSPNRGEIRS